MALNLIKVRPADAKGSCLVGVTAIASVSPRDPEGSVIRFADGSKLEVIDSPSAIFDLANRRPPDGF